MKNKIPQLKDGSEWIDHEDCIIGDEAGLNNLIKACETALKEGEYHGSDLGDYSGVKKLDSSWFINPKDSVSTRLENAGLGIFLCSVLGLILVGLVTVAKWVF